MDPMIWSIVFLILMVVSVGLEIFTPSFGLLTLLGLLFIVAGVTMAFKSSPTMGFTMFAINFTIFPLAIYATIHFLKRSRLMHTDVIQVGPVMEVDAPEKRHPVEMLVGKQGRAATSLRPSGVVLVEDQRLDVVTDGKFVEAGQPIKILRIDGRNIVVEPIIEEA